MAAAWAAASSRALRSASTWFWYFVSRSTVVLRCAASWVMRFWRLVRVVVTALWASLAAVSASVLAVSAEVLAVSLALTFWSAMVCMLVATASRASTFWTLALFFSPARVRATSASARSASDSLVRYGVSGSSGLPLS